MPQLILTANPESNALALAEFQRDSINGQPWAELGPGQWLVDCDEGFWGLAEVWIHEPPIFVRHICPIDLTVPLIATPKGRGSALRHGRGRVHGPTGPRNQLFCPESHCFASTPQP